MDKWSFLYRFLGKLFLSVIAVWLIVSYVMVPERIAGQAMSPALRDGDLGLFYCFGDSYVNDVVLYQSYDGVHVGRVMAKEGQTVDFTEGTGILIDGYGLEGDAYRSAEGGLLQSYPLEVPEGCFFLLNDDTSDLRDSRTYGLVPEKDVRGKLLFLFRRRDF